MNLFARTIAQTQANVKYISHIINTMKQVVDNPGDSDEIATAAFIDYLASRAGRPVTWQYRIKMISGSARVIISDLKSEELRKQLDADRCFGGVYHIDADLKATWVPSSKEGILGRALRPMKNLGATSFTLNLLTMEERMELIERKLDQPTRETLEELASLLMS